MAKRTVVVLVTLVLLISPLFSLESQDLSDDISNALNAFLDCVSAAVVTSFSETDFVVPSTVTTVYEDSGLPARISFFLADPAEITQNMEDKLKGDSHDFFASLLSLFSKSVEDPYLTAVYLALATRNYKESEYIINGWIGFSYPEEITVDDILSIWKDRNKSDGSIALDISMTVFGTKFAQPVSVVGKFNLSVNDKKQIEIKSVDTYMINDDTYINGIYTFF